MNNGTRGIRLSFVAAGGLASLILAAILGPTALAQMPAAGPLPNQKKIYTNKLEFHLPVRLPDEHRANLREMLLYVKPAQADWARQDSIPPSGTRFTYRVPMDGEYFFTVVTVDKSGKSIPADVRQVPPGLRVVVDTLPPQLEVHPWTSPEGDVYIKCVMTDANPNPNSIRLTIRNTSGIEAMLDPVNGQPGLFRISGPEMVPVRVAASDLAENTTTLELNAREMLGEKFAGPGAPTASRPDLQSPAAAAVPNGPSGITSVGYTPDSNRLPVVVNSTKNDLPSPPPGPSAKEPRLPSTIPALPPSLAALGDNLPKIPSVPSPSTTVTSRRQMLRSTLASVDYRIDQVGSSGVGKVEVYLTADDGQTWKKLKEDANKRSPVAIELPGEGIFGLNVVVTNGNGFGGTPPRRGDAPSFSVEVDTTNPFVQLRPIEATAATAGSLEIRWFATDKNLHTEPVSLYYRSRQDGPWQTIVQHVKNDGLYRWPIPRDAGPQFFVKVEVADQAGNVGRAESTTPIVLDLTEPKGVVVGVTAGSPAGN